MQLSTFVVFIRKNMFENIFGDGTYLRCSIRVRRYRTHTNTWKITLHIRRHRVQQTNFLSNLICIIGAISASIRCYRDRWWLQLPFEFVLDANHVKLLFPIGKVFDVHGNRFVCCVYFSSLINIFDTHSLASRTNEYRKKIEHSTWLMV